MKTKTLVVVIGVVIIAIAVIMLPNLVSKKTTQQASAASLEAAESFFDFGEVLLSGGLVETEYKLTNTGNEPITIGKVYTSCMCTTATIIESNGNEKGEFGMPGHRGQLTRADSVVVPGESVTVKVIYDPAAHGPSGVGLAQRSVYLETDSTATPKVELQFKAIVRN